LAETLGREGDTAGALAAWLDAAHLAPGDLSIHLAIVRLCERRTDWPTLLAEQQRWADSHPDDPHVMRGLAEALGLNDQIDAAVRVQGAAVQRVKADQPDDMATIVEFERFLARLQRLQDK
jgi:Flp pilus assembly protein TadD